MIRWLRWSAYHLNPAAGTLYFERLIRPTFSDRAADPGVLDEALREIRRCAGILDAYLEGRAWLVGGGLSYADFRAATPLPFAQAAGLPIEEFPHLRRWHERLWELDAWREPFAGVS